MWESYLQEVFLLEETSAKDGGPESGITNPRILVQAVEQAPRTQGTGTFQAHNTSLPRENMCKRGKLETRKEIWNEYDMETAHWLQGGKWGEGLKQAEALSEDPVCTLSRDSEIAASFFLSRNTIFSHLSCS